MDISDMVMEFNYIQMDNIKGIGKIIKQKGKGLSIILTEMYIKENGEMIKYMDMEYIKIRMVLYMMECGRMM